MACPMCKKETMPKFRPFCSSRCADADLARWFRGDYFIPASGSDDAENNSENMIFDVDITDNKS